MVESFLTGKLSRFDKQNFIEHVKSCKLCHEELEIYHVIYSVIDELGNEDAKENSNYMVTLEKKLGTVSTSDLLLTSVSAAYGFIAAGLAAIAAGIILLFI